LDSEFLALSLVFILIGVSGIILFNGPMTPAGDSCYCLIPSPEPGAAQGTSSIILALGILFFPMGLMKGGLPAFGKGPGIAPKVVPGAPVFTPVPLSSGRLFTTGILLLVIGIDALLVPGYLIFRSTPLTLVGAAVAVLGALALVEGWRRPRSSDKP
jgi:hypothetical protein